MRGGGTPLVEEVNKLFNLFSNVGQLTFFFFELFFYFFCST